MTHYSAEQWADFVRNLTASTEQAAMQGHLGACPECRSTVEWLGTLVHAAALDSTVAIPPEVAARARALFKKPKRDWLQGLRELAAELVSDSSLNLLPAGVRGVEAGSGAVRHLSYRAGDYDVDLRIEPSGEGFSEIVGQIASRRDQEHLEGELVQVIARGKAVGETETNRFGEFVLERPVKPTVTLRIALRRAGCRIDLALGAVKRT